MTAPRGIAVTDDECLARGIAKFLETANDEGDQQQGEAVPWKPTRDEQVDRKKGKHDERDDNEWFAAVAIGIVRRRNDAQRRRQHFHSCKDTNFFRTDADVIHREDHDPDVWNPFAESNQDVAQEQPSHWRIEFTQTLPKIPRLLRRRFLLRFIAQLPLHKNRGAGKND